MRQPIYNVHGGYLPVFVFCLSFILLIGNRCSEASVYHKKGICSYKEKYYKPGDSFRRGCDKCFCHQFGFYCFAPTKPTSWPKKCLRVRTSCGYTIVYKENQQVECRAYSWIG